MGLFDPESIAFLNLESKLRVIEAFLRQLDEYGAEIKALVDRGDAVQVGRTAHRLKGACLALKADDLAAVCMKVEKEAPQPGADLSQMAAEIQAKIDATRPLVQTYLKSIKKN